jgi:hypothetical protein
VKGPPVAILNTQLLSQARRALLNSEVPLQIFEARYRIVQHTG